MDALGDLLLDAETHAIGKFPFSTVFYTAGKDAMEIFNI